jgi:hypothetical protein
MRNKTRQSSASATALLDCGRCGRSVGKMRQRMWWWYCCTISEGDGRLEIQIKHNKCGIKSGRGPRVQRHYLDRRRCGRSVGKCGRGCGLLCKYRNRSRSDNPQEIAIIYCYGWVKGMPQTAGKCGARSAAVRNAMGVSATSGTWPQHTSAVPLWIVGVPFRRV